MLGFFCFHNLLIHSSVRAGQITKKPKLFGPLPTPGVQIYGATHVDSGPALNAAISPDGADHLYRYLPPRLSK